MKGLARSLTLTCCDDDQMAVIIFLAAEVALILALWRCDKLLKPFKLLAVFVHEASHASACALTGGSVEALEVNLNEGGVTKYRGGCQAIVAPAGYIGGAVWGAVGTALVGTPTGRLVLMGILGGALLLTLASLFCANVDHPKTTASVCVFFLGLLVLLYWLDARDLGFDGQLLLFALLFVATFVSFFSVYDIYDDCVRRYVADPDQTSDAVVCERICPILPARGWGVTWLLFGLACWGFGIYVLLLTV